MTVDWEKRTRKKGKSKNEKRNFVKREPKKTKVISKHLQRKGGKKTRQEKNLNLIFTSLLRAISLVLTRLININIKSKKKGLWKFSILSVSFTISRTRDGRIATLQSSVKLFSARNYNLPFGRKEKTSLILFEIVTSHLFCANLDKQYQQVSQW